MSELRAAVDIETTGDLPGTHEIVQISVVVFNNKFEPLNRFLSYVRPLHPEYAMEEAMNVNKLSLEKLMKEPTPAQVRNLFINWKESHFGDEKIKVLGHNVGQFDVQFLKLFFSPKTYDSLFRRRVMDTSGIAEFLKMQGKIPSNVETTFDALLNHFGIIPKARHDAYEDTLLTIELLKREVQL